MLLLVLIFSKVCPYLSWNFQPFAKRADLELIDQIVESIRDAPLQPFRCVKNLQFCQAGDAVINQNKLLLKSNINYESLISDIHKMNLMSWYKELQHTKLYHAKPMNCTVKRHNVLLVKTDLLQNVYHHFGTMLNAYMSNLIILQLLPSVKITTILWDASLSYSSEPIIKFIDLWRALLGDVILASDIKGNVCVKNLFLGLPPRRLDGLLYNAILPDIPLKGSVLLQKFSKAILSSIDVFGTNATPDNVLWITRTTKTRRVLNEREIISKLREKGYNVTLCDMAELSVRDQVMLASQHRVLVGLHGAGLTHIMFSPRQSVLVELYNCGEEACYRDLALLSGNLYLTQQRHGNMDLVYNGPHRTPKDANYNLKLNSVLRLVEEAVMSLRVEDIRQRTEL